MKTQSCITCGMPLTGNHSGDAGMELPEGSVCRYDSENGALKSPQEIFKGGVEFFSHAAADGDRDLAERLTRANMRSLPYWQTHPFPELEGAEATEEEFAAAIAKL